MYSGKDIVETKTQYRIKPGKSNLKNTRVGILRIITPYIKEYLIAIIIK